MARISFVLPGRGLSGGIRVVVIYANALRARGHEVAIAYFRAPYPRRPSRLAQQLARDLGTATGWAPDHLNEFGGTRIATRPERLAAALPDADVVVATHWLTANPVHALPPSKGRKTYFIQRYEADVFDPAAVDATWRLPMRKIVIADHLQALARDRFGDAQAALVYNGVDREHFHAPPRGLGSPPTIGLMYSTAGYKCVDVALDAVARAREKRPELRLLSFGAARPVAELPLPPGTEFHRRPPQWRIPELYGRCDVWLCGSRSEGFHLPPLEAMACGCPVVSTRVGGPNEYVDEGCNGYLVDVGDAPALADRVLAVVADPERWRAMHEAALAKAARLDWQEAADRFERALLGESV